MEPMQDHTGPAGHDLVVGSMALGMLGSFRSPLVEAAFRRSTQRHASRVSVNVMRGPDYRSVPHNR